MDGWLLIRSSTPTHAFVVESSINNSPGRIDPTWPKTESIAREISFPGLWANMMTMTFDSKKSAEYRLNV